MDFYRMREEAIGYYDNSSRQVQNLVRQFFDSMDTDGDGSVDLDEIHDFLEGRTFLTRFLDGEVFDALDEDEDGSLDFYEFITLFYMIFMMFDCDECGDPLVGQEHLTCVLCFTSANANTTYDICGSCYRRGYFNHRHHPRHLVDYREFILDGGQNNPMHFDQRRPTRQTGGDRRRETFGNIVNLLGGAQTVVGLASAAGACTIM
ncbi:hypothetical protein QQ045_031026 [Rhodiola kirilowii]